MQRECGEGRRNENNEQHVGYFCCNDFFFLSLVYIMRSYLYLSYFTSNLQLNMQTFQNLFCRYHRVSLHFPCQYFWNISDSRVCDLCCLPRGCYVSGGNVMNSTSSFMVSNNPMTLYLFLNISIIIVKPKSKTLTKSQID